MNQQQNQEKVGFGEEMIPLGRREMTKKGGQKHGEQKGQSVQALVRGGKKNCYASEAEKERRETQTHGQSWRGGTWVKKARFGNSPKIGGAVRRGGLRLAKRAESHYKKGNTK